MHKKPWIALHSVANRFIFQRRFNEISNVTHEWIRIHQCKRWNSSNSSSSSSSSRLIHIGSLHSLTQQPSSSPIAATSTSLADDATLYIKGFLAQNESPTDHNAWLRRHQMLCVSSKANWSGEVYGLRWPESGSVASWSHAPLPFVSSGAVVLNVMTRVMMTSSRFVNVSPATMVSAAAADVTISAMRLAFQYHNAKEHAIERTDLLAEALLRLRRRHDRVRVVAHSLGCRYIICAVNKLDVNDRPDSIHLCAPAFAESEMELSTGIVCPSGQATIYYTEKDAVLSVLFRLFHLGDVAVGSSGLLRDYPRLSTVDVSQCFNGFLCHNMYDEVFHKMAR